MCGSETACIRAEVLEIEVDTLTKEIVEGVFAYLPVCSPRACVLICLHAHVRCKFVFVCVRLSLRVFFTCVHVKGARM